METHLGYTVFKPSVHCCLRFNKNDWNLRLIIDYVVDFATAWRIARWHCFLKLCLQLNNIKVTHHEFLLGG